MSFLVLAFAKVASTMLNATATVQSGAVAADQFNNSGTDFVMSMTKMAAYGQMSAIGLGLLTFLVILAIWWSELKSFFTKDTTLLLLVSILGLSASDNSYAYYSKQDWAEWVNVLPNHSAFFIPAVGDTKGNQKQFESVDFLNEKKIGSKRVQIPHTVLKNSGLVDAWVPAAVLVLLDRTPYVVTWTKDPTPDSAGNQEMCVESQDSIEICFNTSIGANVLEEDAAKYLYWFGTEPVSEGTADERKFPSVLYGKHLETVMNTRVFSRIHSAYFAEFSKYRFTDLLTHKSEVLQTVEDEMISEYKKMGITIEYVGIASQFRLTNKNIQDSINGLITAEYNQKSAALRLEVAKVDRYEAETNVMLMKATPYTKWDGKTFPNVPQWLISNETVSGWFTAIKGFFTEDAAK